MHKYSNSNLWDQNFWITHSPLLLLLFDLCTVAEAALLECWCWDPLPPPLSVEDELPPPPLLEDPRRLLFPSSNPWGLSVEWSPLRGSEPPPPPLYEEEDAGVKTVWNKNREMTKLKKCFSRSKMSTIVTIVNDQGREEESPIRALSHYLGREIDGNPG